MSNQYLKLRRSAVPGKVPTTESIDYGEIALNTYDGLAFMKRSGSNGEEVIAIGAPQDTGSLLTTSSFNTWTGSTDSKFFGTASYADYAGNISPTDLTGYVSYSIFNAYTASVGYQITTGSISASVGSNPVNLFLIKSSSTEYLNISASSNAELYSNLFIIKNFDTKQPILTISQSIVQFATQSNIPTDPAQVGGIWFTSTDFYVGLE